MNRDTTGHDRSNAAGDWATLQQPGPATVVVDGVALGKGSRVRLRPRQGTDIVDLALAGRIAEIDRVEEGTDGRIYVVVMLDGDPGRDLGAMSQIGHRFFFGPEELEPCGEIRGSTPAGPRVLVAGLGDTFLAGGAFGSDVAGRMRQRPLPQGVHVADFGIRVMDLAHALQDDYEAAVLLSAVPRGHVPGTLSVSEPTPSAVEAAAAAHAPGPLRALALAHRLGTRCRRALVLECEPLPPASVGESGAGAEPGTPVLTVLDEAVRLAESLLDDLLTTRGSQVGT